MYAINKYGWCKMKIKDLNYKKVFHPVLVKYKQEFFRKKFMHNNLSILLFSIFLTVEQMYYGLYIREMGSLTQKIHFFSAMIMVVFVIISTYFQIKKPNNISLMHKTFEISFGLFGFMIAIARSLLVQNSIFPLPTVYIGVIYGFAVIFCFNPVKSFYIYSITSMILIIELPVFQPVIRESTYIQDILSNNMIAYILSTINYQKHVKEFINQKIISKSNQELEDKTLEIQKMNEKLKYISMRDELTNIYNRRKLNEVLRHEYNKAKRYSEKFSIIILDVDYFKSVNDTYGHNVGDEVLIELVEKLNNNIRSSDILGRWGGEEFLIICPHTDKNQAVSLARKLRKIIQNHEFPVTNDLTCSFGVTAYKSGDTIDDLINRADKALYTAKENGRNREEVVI